MNYVQLYLARLNKVDVLKSPGCVKLALVVILNASGYSNGER